MAGELTMADLGSIRALLIEEDATAAVLTRHMLDEASRAIERLAGETFDVILFQSRAPEDAGSERIDRLLV